MVEPLPRSSTRSVAADWVELLAISSPRGAASWADIVSSIEIESDRPAHGDERDDVSGEMLDAEILDSATGETLTDASDELQWRQAALEEHYPFTFAADGGQWQLTLRPEALSQSSGFCYLSCLLMSSCRQNHITYPKAYDVVMPRHMQRIADYTAGSILGGMSYSFGWPRPDETGTMRAGLESLISKMNQGVLKNDDPAWSGGNARDGAVDVVAWRSFAGRPYQSIVLYGQVASGDNWPTKPIATTSLMASFGDWFVDHPTNNFIRAAFIPFPQHKDCRPWGRYSFEDVARDSARNKEISHGLVIDRIAASKLAYDAEMRLGPLRDFAPQLSQWTDECMDIVRA